ncbi:MAG TPA: sigma-54-dependent Fis family transcriptional regulator [Gammaproteobacteria bacterium]|nr:sigma-54-dependent Fis family transcriptional regulator [Gammaproteobacteria bacterium]
MAWEDWNYYHLKTARKAPDILATDILEKGKTPENAIRILINDDREVSSEDEVKKFCHRYLSLPDKDGNPVCPTSQPVNIYYTDNFELVRSLFMGEICHEEFDGVIQDILNDTNQTERGLSNIQRLQRGVLNPFPVIMAISKENTIIERCKQNRINNLYFAVIKEPEADRRSRETNKEIADFFRFAEKNRQTNTDPRIREYKQIVGNQVLTQIQEFLTYLDKPMLTEPWRKQRLSAVILGESGTGKEAVARLIHTTDRITDTSFERFQPVLVAQIPEGTIQGELFGVHQVYPGETKENNARPIKGYIEKAQNGTLFLDEIGDVPEPIQGGLLRFLQEGKIHPVGAQKWYEIQDVRSVFATHKDLKDPRQSKMRDDFLYRIDGLKLELPNLAERTSDHELLVDFFIARSVQNNTGFEMDQPFHPDLREKLIELCRKNAFPGNIRQLKAFIQRIVLVAERKQIIGFEAYERAVRFSLLPPLEK